MAATCFDIKKVTATDFRGRLKDYWKAARANRVVLVENRSIAKGADFPGRPAPCWV